MNHVTYPRLISRVEVIRDYLGIPVLHEGLPGGVGAQLVPVHHSLLLPGTVFFQNKAWFLRPLQ